MGRRIVDNTLTTTYKIKSDYNKKENLEFPVKPNDKRSDTNDDVTTKTNTVHMNHYIKNDPLDNNLT